MKPGDYARVSDTYRGAWLSDHIGQKLKILREIGANHWLILLPDGTITDAWTEELTELDKEGR